MRVSVSIQQEDTIDAWGALTINDMTYDVLRQYRFSRFVVGIEAKVSILPWTPVTQILLDFLGDLPFDIDLTDTTYQYRFLAEGHLMPVAVVNADIDGNPLLVEYAGEMSFSSVFNPEPVPQLTVFPNPAREIVNIQLTDTEDGVRILDFYNQMGQVVKSITDSPANGVIRCDVNDLPTGMYSVVVRSRHGEVEGIARLVLLDR